MKSTFSRYALKALCVYSLSLIWVLAIAQTTNNNFIEAALLSSSNTEELSKLANHYDKETEALKHQAAKFLLANMHLHYAQTYHWVDSTGSKVEFDELQFNDFKASIRGFEQLKSAHGKLKPQPVIYPDREHLKANYLITVIDKAFEQYAISSDMSLVDFQLFCEYFLPYRISIEPLFDWRDSYRDRFSKIIDTDASTPLEEKINFLKNNINLWFTCTYNLEKRTDPLPRLGSLQILHRKKGSCEDVAALAVFALRSLGIPSTIDVVPYWATSTGGHVLNTAFDAKGQPHHFDILSYSDSLHEFIREPAKVFRLTYSENKNTLASTTPISEIPPYGMLRDRNYIDVTEEYWPVRDITASLINKEVANKVIYACAFNGNKWRPVWWGQAKNSSVTFSKMCQGGVFLPKYYENGKLKAAGYPIASGYKEVYVLKPSAETHTVKIKELKGYLKFKPGQLYKLFYYDNKWIEVGRKIPDEKTRTLVFKNAPKNALLILKSAKDNGKERPFTVTETGERLWW